MSTQVVAQRYAQALFDLAKEQNAVDAFDSDLQGIVQLLDAYPELQKLWRSPVVPTEEKKAFLEGLFRGKIRDSLLSALQLMCDKKRPGMVRELAVAFRTLLDAQRRRVQAQVTTPFPLPEAQAEALRAQLSAKLGQEVEMETAVDPALIGGLLLRVGDQVVDGSLKGRLESLARHLN